LKQYGYRENSNLVLSSRRTSRRDDGGPTGEVESLYGRIGVSRMGDRVRAEERPEKEKESNKKRRREGGAGEVTPAALPPPPGGAAYVPSNDAARAAYGSVLSFVGGPLGIGSQPAEVVRECAAEVVGAVRADGVTDPARKRKVSEILGTGVDEVNFGRLVQWCRSLADYDAQTQDGGAAEALATDADDDGEGAGRMDEEMGVAVVFDSDSEEEEEELDVVVDEDSGDDGGAGGEGEDAEHLRAADGSRGPDADRTRAPGRASAAAHAVPPAHDIDAHWLQRALAPHCDGAVASAQAAEDALKILTDAVDGHGEDTRECEGALLLLLGFETFHLIKAFIAGRFAVSYCIRLRRAGEDTIERKKIEALMETHPSGDGRRILAELRGEEAPEADVGSGTASAKTGTNAASAPDGVMEEEDAAAPQPAATAAAVGAIDSAPIELDLASLALREGARTMSNSSCELPKGSERIMRKGYEEVHVPAVRAIVPPGEKLIALGELPAWTQDAFEGMKSLNRIQSKMCKAALYTSENILLCAPTGAGKTNVAMLTILNAISQYRRHDGSLDLAAFKIVYIAPMKALVQEVVKNFGKRLKKYGITVAELSGDSSLTRRQIADTQLVVTTPEKWDVVTRKGDDRSYTQLVRLVIIDEIHLLHDDRGPVLETIVSRTIRSVEATQEPVRIVGLSATLPNYGDVAAFCRVDPDKGLFFFNNGFRPVPLQQQYIGVTEKRALQRFRVQNEVCYEKVIQQQKISNQVLIFVHSRAECGKTARALRDMAAENDDQGLFVREDGATREILSEELPNVKSTDLRDVLPYGFGIHHAGMARGDRELVEDLFADHHVRVLVSTATLAWGVNLPAHTVIIKGTQVYSPETGAWKELSPLDVMQMLGRAGRPQYDSEGEGIIITAHSELQYYLSLMNLQLPVESQLIKSLADHLNAEIVLGAVQTIREAVGWLGYSFLYVRMLRNPSLYGISEAALAADPLLKQRRLDLVHSAACALEKSQLIRYDRRSGSLQATPLGRVSSHYYISHESMAVYNQHLKPTMTDIELLRLFSLSGEFKHITVREEEKLELHKLANRVPIPVKESMDEPSAKVNVLLQAYISRLTLEGFALTADMTFIQQSASRIMRALFEISLRRSWSNLTKLTLSFSIMVSSKVWRSQSPLRQFRGVPEIICRKLERKDIEWFRYFDLKPQDLGELVGVPKMGKTLHRLVNQFPRFELSAHVQPITRSMLRVELTLTPDFQFDVKVHDYTQLFWIFVEDVNGEALLHHEAFLLKSSSAEEEHVLTFTVPILDPLPPHYFVRVLSDRWLHSEAVMPVSFRHLILPAKFPPPTELLDLQPMQLTSLQSKALSNVYFRRSYREFNPIQTQSFGELFKTDHNVLICAPSGSGKTVCAELAIMRMLSVDADGLCVYVVPKDELAKNVYDDWNSHFGDLNAKVVRLTGEAAPDLKLIQDGARIVVATVGQWDLLSRRWKQRRAVQNVSLFIADELHFLGGGEGPAFEVIISRMRFMAAQMNKKIRMVGLSSSVANAREIGEWMGVGPKGLFNFSPKVRPIPLEIYLQSFDINNFSSRLLAMGKPVYNAVARHGASKPVIVFVPSKRQAQLTAIDLMTFSETFGTNNFLGKGVTSDELSKQVESLKEPTLQQVVVTGVGFIHDGMDEDDYNLIAGLYRDEKIRILVCPYNLCWKLRESAQLVLIMGTESYDGRERRHVDHPITDMLQMMGKACRPLKDSSGKCVILCHTPKKEYLKKLLYEPLPIESHLDHYLHDHVNSEIVTKTITNMQDAVDYVTWTLLYRRLTKNPNYYALQGSSHELLSEHISEMVETVLGDLVESRCCAMDDDTNISPLNLGMIAAYYHIQYTTIEVVASSVGAKTKTRGMVEILSAASEFSSLPVRNNEERAMKILAQKLPHRLPDAAQFHDPNTKANVLLQSHFSRIPLSADLRSDQKKVIGESLSLIQAIVDVISSNGWLKPALAAMELSQMVVQGLWNKDNILLQIPHFTKDIVTRCESYKDGDPVESVFDILSLEDDVRNDLLRLPDEKLADVAFFCNNYPNIEVSFDVKEADDVTSGEPVQVVVTLEREVDEDEDEDDDEDWVTGRVFAPLLPKEKMEGWWLVVGDTRANKVLSIKRVGLVKSQKVKLEFVAPEAGDHSLTLFCMSDSYLGCDQEYQMPLNVAAGSDSDDDDDDDSDGDGSEAS